MHKIWWAMVALVVAAAACSGDESGTAPEAAEEPRPEATQPEVAPEEGADQSGEVDEDVTPEVAPEEGADQSGEVDEDVTPEVTPDVTPSQSVAVVWQSALDPGRVNAAGPPPTFEADGVTSSIDIVALARSDGAGDYSSICREEVELRAELSGGEVAETCLIVQWRFAVADDFRTDQNSEEALFGIASIVTPEGRQVDTAMVTGAFPGTVDNTFVEVLPFGVPGSVLRFQSGSNLVGFTTHVFEVPPIEQFQPIDWV